MIEDYLNILENIITLAGLLDVETDQKYATKIIDDDYTILITDNVVWVDASVSDIIITLIEVSKVLGDDSGQTFKIEKIDSSANKVTVKGNGSELINGDNEFDLLYQYESVEPTAAPIADTGSDWLI